MRERMNSVWIEKIPLILSHNQQEAIVCQNNSHGRFTSKGRLKIYENMTTVWYAGMLDI